MTEYVVKLVDFPGLPEPERITAEVRFARTLEKDLGGAEGVASAYRAWEEANEAQEEAPEGARGQLAARWVKASEKARLAGFRELGQTDSAYFEVRVA